MGYRKGLRHFDEPSITQQNIEEPIKSTHKNTLTQVPRYRPDAGAVYSPLSVIKKKLINETTMVT